MEDASERAERGNEPVKITVSLHHGTLAGAIGAAGFGFVSWLTDLPQPPMGLESACVIILSFVTGWVSSYIRRQ